MSQNVYMAISPKSNFTTKNMKHNKSVSKKKKKTRIDLALEDIKQGRISPVFNSVDEMFRSLES